MAYRITKEIGTGWSESLECVETAWGVSESQRKLAKSASRGDIFVHYIDHAHAWAGYSTVTGEIQKNDRDAHADWLAALPYVIPIKRGMWLDAGQCEHTVTIPGLSPKHFNRQVAFTELQESDAKCIKAAIDEAASTHAPPTEQFMIGWNAHAESYYKAIVKGLARGTCQLCRESADRWSRRTAVPLAEEESASLLECFLDAAHIMANHKKGTMMPDNLRALCPTCHRIVDRLPDQRREELLKNLEPPRRLRR